MTTIERLAAAGCHADLVSTRHMQVRVISDKSGLLIMATQHRNGAITRQERTYRLHSDLLQPGQSGRGEIIDAIDRTVNAMAYASVQELVAHLSPGRVPLNQKIAKVA